MFKKIYLVRDYDYSVVFESVEQLKKDIEELENEQNINIEELFKFENGQAVCKTDDEMEVLEVGDIVVIDTDFNDTSDCLEIYKGIVGRDIFYNLYRTEE